MLRGQRANWHGAMRCERVCMPPAAAGELLDLASARQALSEAEAAAEHAGNAWAETRRAADAEATRAQMLQSQATARRTALLSPERVAQRQDAQGGSPRRAAIMICWRGGWARPRRRWTASARR